MAGDGAIRWQTMRDLLDAPQAEWEAERQQTLERGWGARLLGEQEENGRWGGGIYSPKWISSTYTLLTLIDIGIPATHDAAQRGAQLVLREMLGETCDERFQQKLADCDRCIVGMLLRIGVYFQIDQARLEAIVANLLAEQMPDAAWNCRRHRRPKPHHSSFHTTFNVLGVLLMWPMTDRLTRFLEKRFVTHEEIMAARARLEIPNIYIGVSGFNYKSWGDGVFYPKDLPGRKRMEYYSRRFPTVEISSTFHQLPEVRILQGWRERTPEGFVFSFRVGHHTDFHSCLVGTGLSHPAYRQRNIGGLHIRLRKTSPTC